MQNIGYIIEKLLRNIIHKIIVIHWISHQPFAQPGPEQQWTNDMKKDKKIQISEKSHGIWIDKMWKVFNYVYMNIERSEFIHETSIWKLIRRLMLTKMQKV